MPNWCNNVVEITHEDPSKLEPLVAAIKAGDFCKHVIPVPRELTETSSPNRDALSAEQLRAKYGASDWYDFCVNRWGTKWDVDAYEPDEVQVEGNTVTFGFDSAWSPPVGIYEELCNQGFEVRGYYYESGMAYCGVWDNGYDDYLEIGGMSSEQMRDEIPEALDEMFGISESMAEWEEENKDEVTQWYEEGVDSKGLEPHK